MMTEEQFEQLWQRAEAQRFGDELAHEYPAWKQRSQTRHRIAMGAAALLLATGISLPLFTGNGHDGYERVYCNHTGTSDAQWVDLASDLLMMS